MKSFQNRKEDSVNSVFSDGGDGMMEGSRYFLSNKHDNIYTVEETGSQKGLVAIINNFTIESHRDFRGGKCYIVCDTLLALLSLNNHCHTGGN